MSQEEQNKAQKLIVPAEIKVCATCSYWDGERQVDAEMRVVVVDAACAGECLAQEKQRDALNDVRQEQQCIWEDLEDEQGEQTEQPAA